MRRLLCVARYFYKNSKFQIVCFNWNEKHERHIWNHSNWINGYAVHIYDTLSKNMLNIKLVDSQSEDNLCVKTEIHHHWRAYDACFIFVHNYDHLERNHYATTESWNKIMQHQKSLKKFYSHWLCVHFQNQYDCFGYTIFKYNLQFAWNFSNQWYWEGLFIN